MAHSPSQLSSHLAQGESFRILYRPLQGKVEEHLIRVCRIVKARRGVTLVIDEIDKFTTAVWMPDALYDLFHYGRHARVAVIGIARRVSDVPRALTSQCTEIVSFIQTEPRDLKEWQSRAGVDFARRLPQLAKHHFASWKPTGEVFEAKSLK